MEGEYEVVFRGKPEKIIFTMWAIEENDRLRREKNIPDHKISTGYTTSLVYSGLANARRIENKRNDILAKELDFTWNDVNGWVYDLFDTEDGFKTVEEISDCFTKCNAFKNFIKRQEDDAKKNSNGTLFTPSPSGSLT